MRVPTVIWLRTRTAHSHRTQNGAAKNATVSYGFVHHPFSHPLDCWHHHRERITGTGQTCDRSDQVEEGVLWRYNDDLRNALMQSGLSCFTEHLGIMPGSGDSHPGVPGP